MAPADYLSLVVEVSIAIAGFSGIAFALGDERTRHWGRVERVRFQALVSTALLALGASALVLLLLSADVAEPVAWRVGSTISGTGALLLLYRRVSDLVSSPDARASRLIVYAFAAPGCLVVLLLFVNAALLQVFWPFAVGVTYHLAMALFAFAGLITPPGEDDEATA